MSFDTSVHEEKDKKTKKEGQKKRSEKKALSAASAYGWLTWLCCLLCCLQTSAACSPCHFNTVTCFDSTGPVAGPLRTPSFGGAADAWRGPYCAVESLAVESHGPVSGAARAFSAGAQWLPTVSWEAWVTGMDHWSNNPLWRGLVVWSQWYGVQLGLAMVVLLSVD